MHKSFLNLPEEKRSAIEKSGILEFSKKSYADASTDVITRNCGISKGLLFHYFGSKKAFYLYCLTLALDRLTTIAPEPKDESFHGIIFAGMDEKIRLAREYPDEMRLVVMASREAGNAVADAKNALFLKYHQATAAQSAKTMARAMALLPLKDTADEKAAEALSLYTGAIINRYMVEYRDKPDEFVWQADAIKAEIRRSIDYMLYGVAKEGQT